MRDPRFDYVCHVQRVLNAERMDAGLERLTYRWCKRMVELHFNEAKAAGDERAVREAKLVELIRSKAPHPVTV